MDLRADAVSHPLHRKRQWTLDVSAMQNCADRFDFGNFPIDCSIDRVDMPPARKGFRKPCVVAMD